MNLNNRLQFAKFAKNIMKFIQLFRNLKVLNSLNILRNIAAYFFVYIIFYMLAGGTTLKMHILFNTLHTFMI